MPSYVSGSGSLGVVCFAMRTFTFGIEGVRICWFMNWLRTCCSRRRIAQFPFTRVSTLRTCSDIPISLRHCLTRSCALFARSARSKQHVQLLAVFDSDELLQQQDTLELLWMQVGGLQKREWKETAVRRPYISFDDILVTSMQHELPAVVVPPHVASGRDGVRACVYPYPEVSFRLFGLANIPEDCQLPPSRTIERYLSETGGRGVDVSTLLWSVCAVVNGNGVSNAGAGLFADTGGLSMPT